MLPLDCNLVMIDNAEYIEHACNEAQIKERATLVKWRRKWNTEYY